MRELQAALSINKSELARILRVSRPTVYDWLDGGEPNADNRSRIRTLLRLVVQSRVSASDPLFPRFVKFALDPGDGILLDLLSEETIDEATAGNLMRRAKALGDAIDAEREGRLREGGLEEVDGEESGREEQKRDTVDQQSWSCSRSSIWESSTSSNSHATSRLLC